MTVFIVNHSSQKSIKKRAALAYAMKLQWRVFPLHHIENGVCTCYERERCNSPGKHPRVSNGLHAATKDERIINQWWTQWPNANIASPTGAVNGFIAVDIDLRHGGNESFDDLISEYGNIPDTVEAITGSQGRHILFRHPGGTVKNQSDMLPGIDIRGDGGYIVVAPSNHISGNEYGWEDSSRPLEVSVADMSGWLHDMLVDPENGENQQKGTSYWVEVLQGVGKGHRNISATSLAGKLLRHGIDAPIAYELILLWNERCNPPEDKDVIEKTFNSILKKELERLRERS